MGQNSRRRHFFPVRQRENALPSDAETVEPLPEIAMVYEQEGKRWIFFHDLFGR